MTRERMSVGSESGRPHRAARRVRREVSEQQSFFALGVLRAFLRGELLEELQAQINASKDTSSNPQLKKLSPELVALANALYRYTRSVEDKRAPK